MRANRVLTDLRMYGKFQRNRTIACEVIVRPLMGRCTSDQCSDRNATVIFGITACYSETACIVSRFKDLVGRSDG